MVSSSKKNPMAKKNGQKIHTNMLQPSTQDMVALALAVEERFLDLCAAHRRIKGVEIRIPPSLDRDLLLWRTLRVRHKKGDFRNTDDEKKATRRVAEWSLEQNCLLRGQTYKKIEWSD